MQTQEAVISGKTVTHPTDAMCWDDLPGGTCSMEYRPPSAMELTCSWQRGVTELTKVSCVIGAGYWLITSVVLPYLANAWNRLGMISLVAGLLIGALIKLANPTPSKGKGVLSTSVPMTYCSVFAVLVITVVMLSPTARFAGVLAYSLGGAALLGILARQVVQHRVGWHSANPSVPDSQREQWRAGANQLLGALKSGNTDFQNLALEGVSGYVVVVVGLVLHPAIYFGCQLYGAATWSWWVPLLTIFSLLVFNVIWVRHSQSNPTFAAAMGHWLDYQRDAPSSPLLYQSPAGTATHRSALTWATLAFFVVGMAAMLSNNEFLARLDQTQNGSHLALGAQGWAIFALMDTTLAALSAPWLVWFGLRIIVTPALVAALLLNELPPPATASPVTEPNESQPEEHQT